MQPKRLSLLIILTIFSTATTWAALPQCGYSPNWTAFREGRDLQEHFMSHSGPANAPGSRDGYRVLFPAVAVPYKAYSTIRLFPGDEIVVDACGCVQTGGVGKTWKRYVDPQGPNSDRLYHGVIVMDGALTANGVLLRHGHFGTWTFDYIRIVDLMRAQKNGARLRATAGTTLKLGYEDDDYGDNGYGGHDNGTGDQCANVGGAVVEVIVNHH